MCGIAGSVSPPRADARAEPGHVARMIATLVHRGPDDSGLWAESESGVCLGHRRLAILDCSQAGHQPMVSASQRYVVAFNGEIYNHLLLRDALAAEGCAPAWRGTSDTETMAAAFDAWGVEQALTRFVGMFAIAAWDRERRVLVLARDRIGEKPLYYGRLRGTWLFGSELKALAAHPAFQGDIDPQALSDYMRLGYVPAPASIWRGVSKVSPGCLVTIDAAAGTMTQRAYWSVLAAAAGEPPAFDSDAQAIDAAESLMRRAVSQQMISDRPLGALLSGGIDSSCIVALMSLAAREPVRTFSIGFHESAFNEAEYARSVAQHLGTHHTDLYVSAAQAREVIPLLPDLYDEPFADASQIPTYLVSKLARGSVTVALTGDGGDELFGGYPHHVMGARLWNLIRRVPAPMRQHLGALLERASPAAIDRLFARMLPQDAASGAKALRPAQKLTALARVLRSRDPEALYLQLMSHWSEQSVLAEPVRGHRLVQGVPDTGAATTQEDFMRRDLLLYLPDDILAKTDRASMAVSLETRAPLLDHRVVEFALRLPLSMKIRQGQSKWLLRQVLYRHVPQALVDRPKMGFSVPIGAWLRGPLREWAGDLIASAGGPAAGLLDRAALARMLAEHAAGVRDRNQQLWAALMFLAWARHDRSVVDAACPPSPMPAPAPDRPMALRAA